MAENTNGKKAIDEQNVYIKDTLMSIASNYAQTLKDAVNSAFDSAEAGTLSAVGKDLTRSFTQLAKMSDEFALNQGRITAGILKERDVAKQLQSIAERRESLDRKMLHARQLGVDFSEEDYQAALKSLDLQEQMLTQDKQQLANIEKSIGLTGKLVESLGNIPGIGKFLQADEIEIAMRKAAAGGAGSFKTMGIAASMVGKQLAAGLTDPLFIIGEIFTTYLAINKASVDVQRLTGQNAVTAASWNTSLASAKDYLETVSELTAQTGRNAQNVFSKDVLSGAAELKVTMGLAADEAGGIATMAQTSGKSVNNITKSVVATTSAFNKANRSAVSQGVVLKDVAKASDSIKLSLANNPESLAKAASAAARLGMSLQDVDNIASSLLNFEDSISNELEAELLIGKDLNLEKARELALSNDLKGLGDELFKNSADIHEFGKMNRIQQEAQAKALGMTRDQLAKVAYQKALDANMTEEQAAAAADVNAEDMKRISAQENFAKALEKIAGAVAPILDLVGSILSIPFVPYLVLGALAVGKIGGGLLGSVKSMASLVKGAGDFVKSMNPKGMMEYFEKLKGAFGEGIGGKAQEAAKGLGDKVKDAVTGKAEDAAGGLADKAKDAVVGKAEDAVGKATEAAGSVPEKSGGGMSSLTESIQKIKPSQILAGAAALVLVAASVFVFAKAAQEFATVSWEDMAKAGVGLLGLVAALAAVGAIMMSGVGAVAILAGAAAIAVMAGGLFILGKALQEIGAGMNLMAPALTVLDSLGSKAAALGTVQASLMGIADGLREVSEAGTGAIPVLDKLVALGSGGNSIGESKSKAEEGSLAAVEAKLVELITVVRAGGNVYLDSNKVGRTQVLSSYKSA
jgi:hypothetical protein